MGINADKLTTAPLRGDKAAQEVVCWKRFETLCFQQTQEGCVSDFLHGLPHLGWLRWFWALAAPWTSLRLTHYPGPQTQWHICNKPGDRSTETHRQKEVTNTEHRDQDQRHGGPERGPAETRTHQAVLQRRWNQTSEASHRGQIWRNGHHDHRTSSCGLTRVWPLTRKSSGISGDVVPTFQWAEPGSTLNSTKNTGLQRTEVLWRVQREKKSINVPQEVQRTDSLSSNSFQLQQKPELNQLIYYNSAFIDLWLL